MPRPSSAPAVDFAAESATDLFRAIFAVGAQWALQIALADSRENPAGPAGMKTRIDGFKPVPR